MRPSDTRGAAYVELLVVAPPLLLLFFGLTQVGLVYGAELLVQHAAARAARAAIVVLPDDHEDANYAGDPPNSVGEGEGLDAYRGAAAGGRLDAIRKAARLTLAPVSPSLDSLAAGSIAAALGEGEVLDVAAGLVGFTAMTVAVTFPNGSGGYATSFGPRDPVTARVTFLYRCAVPVARSILCGGYSSLDPEAAARLETVGSGAAIAATLSGSQVVALEAERTLPNQGR